MTTLAQNVEPSLRTRQLSSSQRPLDGGDFPDSPPACTRSISSPACRNAKKILADNLLGPITFNFLRSLVPGLDASVRIEHEDRIILDLGHQPGGIAPRSGVKPLVPASGRKCPEWMQSRKSRPCPPAVGRQADLDRKTEPSLRRPKSSRPVPMGRVSRLGAKFVPAANMLSCRRLSGTTQDFHGLAQ